MSCSTLLEISRSINFREPERFRWNSIIMRVIDNGFPTWIIRTRKETPDDSIYDLLKSKTDLKCKLRSLRKEAGLTQDQMAKLIGSSKRFIEKNEDLTNKTMPSLDLLKRYLTVAGYSLELQIKKAQ